MMTCWSNAPSRASTITQGPSRASAGVPAEELLQLKQALYMQFPNYWNSPQEFGPLWNKCKAAIGQACKRLRANAKIEQVHENLYHYCIVQA